MKHYTITVNGTAYDVTVEEKAELESSDVFQKEDFAKDERKQSEILTNKEPVPVVKSGKIKIKAGAAGKIFRNEVSIGQTVKRGDSIVIVEAMKMEIPIVTPTDGTVVSIEVSVGQNVEAGDLLATLNPI